jgi:hypothetical protein
MSADDLDMSAFFAEVTPLQSGVCVRERERESARAKERESEREGQREMEREGGREGGRGGVKRNFLPPQVGNRKKGGRGGGGERESERARERERERERDEVLFLRWTTEKDLATDLRLQYRGQS